MNLFSMEIVILVWEHRLASAIFTRVSTNIRFICLAKINEMKNNFYDYIRYDLDSAMSCVSSNKNGHFRPVAHTRIEREQSCCFYIHFYESAYFYFKNML